MVLVRAWLAHCLRVRTDSVARCEGGHGWRSALFAVDKGIEDGIIKMTAGMLYVPFILNSQFNDSKGTPKE